MNQKKSIWKLVFDFEHNYSEKVFKISYKITFT